jgi:DNA-directed RNA polymerase specialized sigma24 family protein
MIQGDLFGPPERPEFLPWQRHEKPTMAKFQEHSQNSVDAALSINAKAPSIRERVFQLLREEALTDEQIAKRLDLSPNTARPRRIELANKRRIVEAGRVLTESGRYASTWRAA